ncbi:GPW/gp25 family protein [Andreprevotia chitinilytica]|uniref:GPW/gp25 family protein n=1 Tax=Andreprevotia chitinilytica TaxID=396808 RepID=UPI000690E219|nr:GPW/gp25 family protein [Andreprevotia chitinilytica]
MYFLLERLAASPQALRTIAMPHDAEFAQGELEALIVAQITRIVANRPLDKDDANLLYNFGMPSVVEVAMHSDGQLARYAARLEAMIRKAEPRLENPRVSIVPGENEWNQKQLFITGSIRCDQELHPFQFTVNESA